MFEHEIQKLLQEYTERSNRWTDRTLSQMSFYNNLLLALGIGFLSFVYQDSRLADIEFRFKDIDYSITAYVLSIWTVMFSIITGLIASISRLYDFRITSDVNQIRRRVFEHSHIKIDEKSPQKFPYMKRMLLPYKLFLSEYPKITLEQCKAWQSDNLNEKFSELRAMAFNLGLGTWCRIKYQTILLLITIILYVVSVLLA